MTTPSGFQLIADCDHGFLFQIMKDGVDIMPGCLYEPYSRQIYKKGNLNVAVGKYNTQTGLFELSPGAFETRKFNPENGLEVNESAPETTSDSSSVSKPLVEQSTPTPMTNIDDELALRKEPLSMQLEKLAAKLREEEAKMDFEERELLSPKVLDADSKELAQLQFSSATTLDLLESMQDVLSKLQPELEEKHKFVNGIKEYCHLDRHELIKLLFERDKQLLLGCSFEEELEQRNKEYDDLVYRFKCMASLFRNTLADPSDLDREIDYGRRFDCILTDKTPDWSLVNYSLWKLSERDNGIVVSESFPVKKEWDLKSEKH